MATEEIHLNKHLEKAGIEVQETDLGEWIIQLAGQTAVAHGDAGHPHDQGGGCRGFQQEGGRAARSRTSRSW